MVQHNNNWLGTMHRRVIVEGKELPYRFRTSYTNPFATHFNSKQFQRYMAVVVPKELIKDDALFINVEIDMTEVDNPIYIREIGTHSY